MTRKLSKHVNVRCFHTTNGRRCINDATANGRCSVHNVRPRPST